jgi:DeoR family transcriptional regulator of aga operon
MRHRHDQILAYLERRSRATVAELSAECGVSAMTIRSDLAALDAARRLRRVRGGAEWYDRLAGAVAPFGTAAVPIAADFGGDDGAVELGRAAARLVPDDATVILDQGPTFLALAEALTRSTPRALTVHTADLAVALCLRTAGVTVVVAGGTLDPATGSLTEPFVGPALDGVQADLALLGCHGVDAAAGVTGHDPRLATIWRRLRQAARQRILLAPGAAIGRRGQVTLCGLADVDLCLSSGRQRDRDAARLRRAGLVVRLV